MLDAFVGIRTAAALLGLKEISEMVETSRVRAGAKAKIIAIADGPGPTANQLADRPVPDLCLAPDGTRVLDYGMRPFTLGFDEQLKPTVYDEDCAPRMDFPNLEAKDDPELAPVAEATKPTHKKDARSVGNLQVRRLCLPS